MALESNDQKLEDKTAKKVNFGCSRKEEVPVITEIDVQFTKINLSLVNIEKNSENLFLKSLQALAVRLKNQISSVNAHYEIYCTFIQRFCAMGLQQFCKT